MEIAGYHAAIGRLHQELAAMEEAEKVKDKEQEEEEEEEEEDEIEFV